MAGGWGAGTRRTTLAVAVCVLVSACGASSGRPVDVQALLRDREHAAAADGRTASTLPAGAAGVADPTAQADSGPTRPGSGTTGGGGAGAGAGAGATSGRSSATALAPTGDVLVGFRYATGGQAVVDSLGLKGVSSGDQRGFAEAMIDHLNTVGGMGAHKLRAVFDPYDAAGSLTNAAAEDQQSCSAFTEDNHVFAVLSPLLSGPTLQRCLTQRRVPFVEDNYNFFNMGDPSLTALYFVPSYGDAPRLMEPLVASLVRDGFFGSRPRIGVARASFENRDRAAAAFAKALQAHGLSVTDTVSFSTPDQVSAGVLRFKAQDITHVFVIEGSGGLETQLWMTDAEQQRYRPRYVLDTQSGPFLLQANAPREQLRRSEGIGWIPSVDVGTAVNSPADRACLDIMHAAGKRTDDLTATRFALATCDVFLFFAAVLSRATVLDAGAFVAAAEGLGDSYTPTGSFASRFGRGRHDGTSAVRKLRFDDACPCFRYFGDTVTIG
jgi:hypothetical protein